MEAVLEARRRAIQAEADAAAIAAGDAAAVSEACVDDNCRKCVQQIFFSPALGDIFVSEALVVPPVELLAGRVAAHLTSSGFSATEAGGQIVVTFTPAAEIPISGAAPESSTPGGQADYQRWILAQRAYAAGVQKLAGIVSADPHAAAFTFPVGSAAEQDFFFVHFTADGFGVSRDGALALTIEVPPGFFV